eukprot:3827717-Pleurochrysis_carterae.AAC.1
MINDTLGAFGSHWFRPKANTRTHPFCDVDRLLCRCLVQPVASLDAGFGYCMGRVLAWIVRVCVMRACVRAFTFGRPSTKPFAYAWVLHRCA